MMTEINGVSIRLETSKEVFSPSGVDKGTAAMLSQADIKYGDKVLDLGCGCGIVGIYAAKIAGEENVVMTDILPAAVQLSKKNVLLNGMKNIPVYIGRGYENITESDFSLILSNPPYHTDFSVAKEFIEGGYKRLSAGGRMIMVTKRLEWYKNKFISVFGGVRIREIDGYYVFIAEKRNGIKKKPVKSKPLMSKKLMRKYTRQKSGDKI